MTDQGEQLHKPASRFWGTFLANYGMLGVLVLLCVIFSALTVKQQERVGADAATTLAREIARSGDTSRRVLIVAGTSQEDAQFAARLEQLLQSQGFTLAGSVRGDPRDARRKLKELADSAARVDLIATTRDCASWQVLDQVGTMFPTLASARVVIPPSYAWPTFLKGDNLLNVANQIVVIAVIAVGMTLVIITGGIDLSVGRLIALSAVVAAVIIRDNGGENASSATMVIACFAAMVLCGLVGAFSGLVITQFRIPPFIATLAMMQVADGLAFRIAKSQSIYQIPDSFVWLGRLTFLGIPNAVILMALIYAAAYVLMSRTTLGRYIYAVGGNREAARLSGVRVNGVVLLAYVASGLMAGLGGVVTASQLKSGSPTYGQSYELYVIAAVVVGGTSLAGGEGKILGTLIGAFIMAVIWNGMNLLGMENDSQKMVLGLVILGAVLLDSLKKGTWSWNVVTHLFRRS